MGIGFFISVGLAVRMTVFIIKEAFNSVIATLTSNSASIFVLIIVIYKYLSFVCLLNHRINLLYTYNCSSVFSIKYRCFNINNFANLSFDQVAYLCYYKNDLR